MVCKKGNNTNILNNTSTSNSKVYCCDNIESDSCRYDGQERKQRIDNYNYVNLMGFNQMGCVSSNNGDNKNDYNKNLFGTNFLIGHINGYNICKNRLGFLTSLLKNGLKLAR